jgi:HPt (histidine-containing phosphotransfer) domain-containing protein
MGDSVCQAGHGLRPHTLDVPVAMSLPPDSPFPPPAASLDVAALARLRELDPEGRLGVLERVLKAFDTSLSRMMGQLVNERTGGNAAVVSAVAHTLKSSSASVGALSLSRACGDVEKRLRSGEPGDLGADIERLLAESDVALVAVRAMLRY